MSKNDSESRSQVRGAWRRWLHWAAIAVAAVALYAVFGFVIVPKIVRSQIEKQALRKLHRLATVERVRFNPFTLVAVVEGLHLKDRDGAALSHLDRLTVDFQVSGIFRRAWRFREIVVEGTHAVARIAADGRLSLADLIDANAAEEPNGKTSPLPRIFIDHLVLRGGRAEFVDESRSPRFVEAIAPLDLELRELSTIPDESGAHTLTLGIGEGGTLRWTGRQTVEPLRLEGKIEITGISLSHAWDYISSSNPLAIRDGRVEVACAYDIRRGADGAFSVAIKDVGLTVRDLALRPRGGGEDWLLAPLVEVRGAQALWPESRVEVGEVRVTGPRALAWLNNDGSVNWQAALAAIGTGRAPSAGGTAAGGTETNASSENEVTAGGGTGAGGSASAGAGAGGSASAGAGAGGAMSVRGSSAGAAARGARPWTATIGAVEILKATAHIEDRRFEPTIVVDLTDADLRLENLTGDLSAPIPTHLSARINGAGEVVATGSVVPAPPSADLAIKLSGLALKPFNPYAIHLPWANIVKGVAGADGRLRVSTGAPAIQFDGALEIADLQIAGPRIERLLACDRAKARGAQITIFPERIRVANVDLEGAFAKLDIDKQGNVNLKRLLATEGEAGAATPAAATKAATQTATPGATAASPSPVEPLYLDIGSVAIRNSTIEYTDESLVLPFGTRIHSVKGWMRDISTTAAAAARLAVEGRISDAGYFKADGTLRIGAPFAATDIGVIFRGVNMPDLTPYSAQFAGYSISKGILDVDVRYRIQDGRLVGDHRVVAKDLTLGPKVEGAQGPGLPVRLAIALLKDKDGRIDLDVPIEGTVDSPEFNYKSVFWQAFKKILANIAMAPFRAIGRLFGADKEDLELVGFPSGESALPAPEQEKLAKMAPELAGRGEISVEVEGRFDPVTDAAAIRRARLEQRIEAKRAGAPNLETILETLYAESFSPERLEAERGKFLPSAAPATPPAEEPKKKRRKNEPPPPPPTMPKEGFDAAGFYDALRSELLAAETVSDADLGELARARAAAIATLLTAPGGLDPARVKALDPSPVKRKKQGSELVPSELMMSAND